MSKGRLLWHLFPSFLLITIAALAALGIYGSYSLRQFYYGQVAGDLRARARLIQSQVSSSLLSGDFEAIDKWCKTTGRQAETRITVILPNGQVVADSDEEPRLMKNHSDRPEIIDAITQGYGRSVRFSSTLGKKLMYVALPLKDGNENVGIIRTSLPVTAIDERLSLIYTRILWGFLVAAVAAAAVSLGFSRRLTRPIEQMTSTARLFAAGRLDLRLPVNDSGELAHLAQAMNEMARQLNDRIAAVTRRKNESQAILASMVEGVLAIDAAGHILSINKAAASLLAIESENVAGRNVEEVVRNSDVQKFIEDTLAGKEPAETDVFLPVNGGRCFQIHGARLGGDKTDIGAVIVLNDITRLRRLEEVRRDFVANVSHELKTPITSIKGFVETLLDSPPDDPERLRRFLEIIARHSDRLNAIIEDLLTLSRLEAQHEQRKLSFESVKLRPLIAGAVELSRIRAEEKHITIEVACDQDIELQVNAPLLEQAVLNLIDNAVKYSDTGGRVEINVTREDGDVLISVKDNGCGMEKKHLSRIFERFYVVDKGRSRKLGGTGLGLAIVKHICQVHGGAVTVQSTPGAGSTFTMRLPGN
jgi:two-component system phosphate regulon sensor histidine kinase PhoR